MEINDNLVNKLAILSRLHFDEHEKVAIKADLEKMIRFVDKLNELDTSNTDPLMHITEHVNILREDEVFQDINRVEALKNAPVKSGQFFIVPKVIAK